GGACGTCGVYTCQGSEALTCSDPGANTCGGCSVLPHPVGSTCGVCGLYACDGANAVQCVDPGLNACGGCTVLGHTLGAACGTCGVYTCQGSEAVTCSDPGANTCGGCTALPYEPGDACACSEGSYTCNGADAVTCTMSGNDNVYTSAVYIGSFDDSDNWVAATRTGTLTPTYDTEDWYSATFSDEWLHIIELQATLDNIPTGQDYDLCVYYSGSSSVGCDAGYASTWAGMNGCCSANAGTAAEHVFLDVNEGGTVYYRVYRYSGTGSCTPYQLQIGF
ncbi:hypothetical protein KKF84_10085, partial [Myxococcota bacterium]|nr:hypothetical protein [Myxococcota bacterium]MBU1535660.1 hypothetical protein [Myxococcota bacterium]